VSGQPRFKSPRAAIMLWKPDKSKFYSENTEYLSQKIICPGLDQVTSNNKIYQVVLEV